MKAKKGKKKSQNCYENM